MYYIDLIKSLHHSRKSLNYKFHLNLKNQSLVALQFKKFPRLQNPTAKNLLIDSSISQVFPQAFPQIFTISTHNRSSRKKQKKYQMYFSGNSWEILWYESFQRSLEFPLIFISCKPPYTTSKVSNSIPLAPRTCPKQFPCTAGNSSLNY